MVISRNNDMPILASHADFSVNHDVAQCWTRDVSYRAKVRELIHDMASYRNAISIHQDLSPNQIQGDEKDVKAIIDIISKHFKSPFEEQELMSLSNGVLPMKTIANDLFTAEEKGLATLNAFIED